MALSKSNKAGTIVDADGSEAEGAPVVDQDQSTVTAEVDVLEPETAPEAALPATTAPISSVPATSNSTTASQLEAEGFAGLHIDWTSFPTIVLDKGEFCTADGAELKKQDVLVRIMQTRSRYVLRTKTADQDDAELAYTYNMAELQNPDSDVAVKVAGWKADNLDYVVKEYIEAVSMVEDAEHPLHQQMVLLQIPPTSVGRFSGYLVTNQLVKKKKPGEYLTRCYRGDKITKANNPFYPWAFEYVG